MGAEARFDGPAGLAIAADGSLLVADYNNNRIRRVSREGSVTTIAGTGTFGAADGPSPQATFAFPVGLALAGDGSLLVLEHGNNAIRRIAKDGQVTTLLRGGTPFQPGSSLSYASGIAAASDGTILVADTGNNRLLRVLAAGASTEVVAGQAGVVGFVDGSGPAAKLSSPRGIAWSELDRAFVFADASNGAVRKVTLK